MHQQLERSLKAGQGPARRSAVGGRRGLCWRPSINRAPMCICRRERLPRPSAMPPNHGRFATDEEVGEVFARMTNKGGRMVMWL